jgi:hypothetical protein
LNSHPLLIKDEIDWIKIGLQYYYSRSKIPPKVIKELAEHEVNPGGPYFSSDHTISFYSNIAIFLMLSRSGIYLKGLERYIDKSQDRNLLNKSDINLKKSVKILLEKKYEETIKRKIDSIGSSKRVEKIWEQIDLSSSQGKNFLDKLKNNSFTIDIVMQPVELNRLWELGISGKEEDSLSLSNVYGWIFFTILDLELDEKEQLLPDLKEIQRDSYMRFIERLEENSDWVELSINNMTNTDEESVILRSRSAFVMLSKFLNKSQISALDYYYLAKQYNDDLHDFFEDFSKKRNSLVISGKETNIEIEAYYLEKVLPSAMCSIEILLDKSEKLLSNWEKYQQLRSGVKDYKDFFETTELLT